ncbi:hypothetical protein Asppvi_009783 [Aspergillus pseudoviridinutans]|uniref:Uncharacterized protein n=1 Tax=Aspergillus pseudoviridinutans TaxID=1517512 RepID=A0A9P3EZG7_9EURO|nr:uncharacterized protein Asppvi_009783 [Aspergillus pseudoviridinutans]GIJ90820.1 hypothetical protein Asppvi_009783 [Aspergillus pseudoviridinutans]
MAFGKSATSIVDFATLNEGADSSMHRSTSNGYSPVGGVVGFEAAFRQIFATQREANLVWRRKISQYDSHYLGWNFLHIEELRWMLSEDSLEQRKEFAPAFERVISGVLKLF